MEQSVDVKRIVTRVAVVAVGALAAGLIGGFVAALFRPTESHYRAERAQPEPAANSGADRGTVQDGDRATVQGTDPAANSASDQAVGPAN